jgi:hypothetical protein
MATDHATLAVGLLHVLERFMFGTRLMQFLKALRGLFGIILWVWVSDSASANRKMIRILNQRMREVFLTGVVAAMGLFVCHESIDHRNACHV